MVLLREMNFISTIFQNELYLAAVSKQLQLWGGCSYKNILCRKAQLLPVIDSSSQETANATLSDSSPIIDVLAQISSLPNDTNIAVNSVGYRFTVMDEDLPSRSMKTWDTSIFLCDDFINLPTAKFARHTSAGHTTSPATRACQYWISPCLPQIDGAAQWSPE